MDPRLIVTHCCPQISHHGAEVPRGGPRVLSSDHEYFSAAGQAQGEQEEGGVGTDSALTGHAVVVVVVVCVGLLLTVLTVGLARLRASHKKSLREEQEVEMVSWQISVWQLTGL